ncbi:uncharacterized protein LOC130901369 [Diorhabda carinulata]|uniref:uncharacterized protein LOC130901369 n=1 Tax=Diorhabda carinulata TaxID=1163345 RepID=UPI0025A13855|nr:uncharacterized protein LOC130901369 [Diorhabda carinulata]
MKCILVLISLVALSQAVPVTFGEGKQVTIDKDGTITILGENGKKIVFTRVIGHPGPKDIEITVGGPNGPIKKIHIDDEHTKTVNFFDPTDADYYQTFAEDREKRSSKDLKESSKGKKDSKTKSQADLLNEIFNEYQGIVDDKSYNDLLTKIDSYVKTGELNQAIYNVLQSFEEYRLAEKYGYQTPLDGYFKNQYPFNYYPSSPYYTQFYGPRVYSPYFGYRYGSAYPYRSYEDSADFQRVFYAQPREQFYPQSKEQVYPTQYTEHAVAQPAKYGQFEHPQEMYGQSGEAYPREQVYHQYGQGYEQFKGPYEYPKSYEQFYEQLRGTYEQPKSTFYGKASGTYKQPIWQQYKSTPFGQDFYNSQYQQQSSYKPFSYFYTKY